MRMPKRLPIIAEGIAGDTAVGHSLCMAQAIEALTDTNPMPGPDHPHHRLELERISQPRGRPGRPERRCGVFAAGQLLRPHARRLSQHVLWMCGNRFGKGLVRPGGVRFPMTDEDRKVLTGRIAELKPQVRHTIELLFSTSSVRARFEGCGAVSDG
jgi:Ni,Fe-hydrogenase III large subunit